MNTIVPYSIETVKSDIPEHDWQKYYKLRKNDIFLEIGAFWGRYAVLADKARCSKIILIEPSPVNVETIKNFVNVERLRNVIIIDKAISNKIGKIKFDISGNSAGHSMTEGNLFVDTAKKEILARNKDKIEIIEIYVDTLDNILSELCINKIDLLASDCEGEEAHVLEGASKYLGEKRIKHVAIGAYHHSAVQEEVIKILNNHGYYGIRYEDGIVYASANDDMLSKEEISNNELMFD